DGGAVESELISSPRLASPLPGLVEDVMIEAFEVPTRARHRIVEDLRRLTDVHPDRLGFLPVHEADRHRDQISRPSGEEASRPFLEARDQAVMAHVPAALDTQIHL